MSPLIHYALLLNVFRIVVLDEIDNLLNRQSSILYKLFEWASSAHHAITFGHIWYTPPGYCGQLFVHLAR